MTLFRTCRRCKLEKPITDFAWIRKRRSQWDTFCRPCRSAYAREHYLRNRRRYIKEAAGRRRRGPEERWQLLIDYLRDHPCVDCGEGDVVVLEFDHLHDKSFEISLGVREKNWETVLSEMEKCEVVCANCHRKRTAKRLGFVRASKLGLLEP